MSLIPGFEYDFFISYAHRDNETISAETKGWIKMFYERLKHDLERAYGQSDITFWWDDRKLDGNEFFDPSIQEGIKKSAVMICLNSPSYGESEWCQKELTLFHKKAQSEEMGLQLGYGSRIVHVLLYDIPHTQWPEAFGDRTGFRFHEPADGDLPADPLEIDSILFKNEMKKLRGALHKLVTFYQNKTDAVNKKTQEANQQTIEDETFTIFMSDVPDSLLETQYAIANRLKKKGFTILMGNKTGNKAESHEQSIKEYLEKSHLSIHLLDQYPGILIEGDETNWYRKKQIELALETPIPQLIWIKSGIDYAEIENDSYRTFVQNLENGTITDKIYEFIIGTKSTLSKEVNDYLEPIVAQRNAKKNKELNTTHSTFDILLDYNAEDLSYAIELENLLAENRFITHKTPLEDDPEKNIEKLQERMNKVQKIVFLYGNASKEWVKARLQVAINKLTFEDHSVEEVYVYMAPPRKEIDEIRINQKMFKVNVINNSTHKAFNPASLEPFITNLKQRSDGA